MAEILPIWRKTLNNQSINNQRIKNVVTLRVFYFGSDI